MKRRLDLPNQSARINNKCSLILRLWRNDNSPDRNWRASVEIPEARKRFGFSSLEQLFAFLIDFTDASCDSRLLDIKEKEMTQVNGKNLKDTPGIPRNLRQSEEK